MLVAQDPDLVEGAGKGGDDATSVETPFGRRPQGNRFEGMKPFPFPVRHLRSLRDVIGADSPDAAKLMDKSNASGAE